MSGTFTFDHRDPSLRPFVEAGAKITRELVDEGRREGLAPSAIVASVSDAATSDAELGAQAVLEHVPALRRLPIACSDGCAACCHSNVHASSAEILRIADHVRATRSPEALAELATRAAATADRVAGLSLEERARARVPCPLLDTERGRCTVYEVRPIACRAYHSGSVTRCREAFEAGEANPVLPVNPLLFQVPHAHGFGVLAGLADAGLDPGPYDLAVALPAALGAELDTRWLAGETVLPHSRITAEGKDAYDRVLEELVRDLREGRLDGAEALGAKLDPEARRRERNRKKRARKGR